MNKYTIPEAVKVNRQRGLALAKKFNRSDINLEDFAFIEKADGLGLDDVKKMYSALSLVSNGLTKHNQNEDGSPTDLYLSYLQLGADAAKAFCLKTLKAEQIIKSHKKDIPDSDLENIQQDIWSSIPVVKNVNSELMQATYVVLEPDAIDAHGDTYDENEVRKACHNFNKYCMKANLLHMVETEAFSFAESYIAPSDILLGETFVKKGTWLAVVQFYEPLLWEDVKKGLFSGLSIGALAVVEPVEETEE